MIYFGSDIEYFYAVDTKTGELIWKHKTKSSLNNGPIIKGNVVIFENMDGIHALGIE